MTRLEDLEKQLQAEEVNYTNIRRNFTNVKFISNPLYHLIPVAIFFNFIGWFRDLFGLCIGLSLVAAFYIFMVFRQSGTVTASNDLLSTASIRINHLRHAINIERLNSRK